MIAAVTVDNHMGTMFNYRRQSRDREVIRDLMETAAGRPVWIGRRSRLLFEDREGDVRVSDDFLSLAGEGEICFVEGQKLADCGDRIESVIVYHWNRDYPYDRVLDLDLSEFTRVESKEFEGYSHECILREVYVK